MPETSDTDTSNTPQEPADDVQPDQSTQPDDSAKDKKAEPDWKTEARKWEQRAKENKRALDDAAPKLSEYDRLVEASKSDLERANEAAQRWQTEAEQWRKTSVSSRIQALASTDFADPADAVMGLSANNYLDAGGVINDDAIKRDLADMLAKKPHYRRATEAADPPKPRVPAPNQHQGSGGGTPALDARQQFAQILQSTLPQPS